MKNKKRFYGILAAALLAVTTVPCYAATTQEKIDAAQQEKQQSETELQTTQERIAALESSKGESEAYLSELNQQLSDLAENLAQLQNDYEEKQTELERVQNELEEAKAQEEQQYEDMKLRIRYMYEHSTSTGVLEALFSADSFTEFLNRADNMSEITRYDREMLDKYEETKEQVEEKERQVQEERAAILKLQDESTEQQEQVQELYEATYNEIMAYAAELEGAQNEESALLQQIQQQEESLNALLAQAKQEEIAAQKAAEEAARQQAAAQQQASSGGQSSGGQSSGGNTSQSSGAGASSGNSAAQETPSGGTEDSGSSSSGTYLGRFKLTAYCSCAKCCGKWAANAGTTASGVKAQQGVTVAMGGVPFGTKLSINGHVYTVQDRGTAYGHVDVYFSSHSDALAFGLQYADVYQVN
jgi:peptidoglycan hydrolase CwlO-like protein/3D (Asp-Asp-Asp) domain-containing protein